MIRLSNETEKQLRESIKRYVAENFDEEIGDLKARLFLDYCVKEIGPSVYNHAIKDAQAHLQETLTDLDGTCFEPELVYWKGR